MSLADRRRILCAAVACAMVALSSPARSDERTDDAAAQAAARALFDEARALLSSGRYAEACPKLAESFRLDSGAGTQINLAHCYERSGQIASAWATFKDAVITARRAGRVEWAERAERRAARLEEQLPTLKLQIAAESANDGMEVRRNGVVVASSTWGSAIPVDPGTYTIDARAPSRRAWIYEVTIAPGEHIAIDMPRLEAEAGPAAPSLPRDDPPPPRTSQTQRTAGIATMAVGGVGVGAGIATGVWALSAYHDVQQKCPPGTPCRDRDAAALSDRAAAVGNISTIAFVAGGALLTLGAILFFSAPKRADRAVQPAVAYLPGGGELLLQSHF